MTTQQTTTEVSIDAGLDLKLDVASVRQELALIAHRQYFSGNDRGRI